MIETVEVHFPEATDDELEPPWDELDPGIVDRVRVLHKAGLLPWSSCQGGPGHLKWYPHILVATSLQTLDEDEKKVVEALLASGEKRFSVARVFHYEESATPDAQFPVTLEIAYPPAGPKSMPIAEWLIQGEVTGFRLSEPLSFHRGLDADAVQEIVRQADTITFQPKQGGPAISLPCTRETYNKIIGEISRRGSFPMQLNVLVGDDAEEIERRAQLMEEMESLPED